MLQLKSVPFIRAVLGMAHMNGAVTAMKVTGGGAYKDSDPIASDKICILGEELQILIGVLQELEAATTLKGAQRLASCLADPTPMFGPFCFLMAHLMLSLKDEFGAQTFLSLSANEARFYLAAEPPFGKAVQDKFPAAVSEDIVEASKCIACARYTASVFHLMRVLEAGVGAFAGKLGVPPIDSRGKDKNWQNFLDEANKAIGKLPVQDQLTKQYATISGNLYAVKIAWRNEVMHPKQTYTEEDALILFAASKAFMGELASVL
jgi:hypothetical protein